MIPVDKLVPHDPDNGQYGDCMRAALASLMDRPTETVPHFYESGVAADYDEKLTNFLKENGVKIIYTEPVATFTGKIYHLIMGTNVRNVLHAVVGLNGSITHDPNPDRMGLSSIDSYGFLVYDDGKDYSKLEEYCIFAPCRG